MTTTTIISEAAANEIAAAGLGAKLTAEGMQDPKIVKLARSKNFTDAFKKVDKLLRSGKDVNAQDMQGNTALHSAAMAGNKELVKRISSHKGCDREITNKKGETAADVALDDATRQQIGAKMTGSMTHARGDSKSQQHGMESTDHDLAAALGTRINAEAAVNTGFHPPDSANPNYVKPKLEIGDNVCPDGPNDGDIHLGIIVGVAHTHMGNNKLPNPDAWTVASIENGQVVHRDMDAHGLRKYKGPDELKLRQRPTEGIEIMTASQYNEERADSSLAESLAAKLAGRPDDKTLAESLGAKLNPAPVSEFQHTIGDEEPESWSVNPPDIEDIAYPGDEIAGPSAPHVPLAKVLSTDLAPSSSSSGEWIITVEPYPAYYDAADDLDLGRDNKISLEFADGAFLDDAPFVKAVGETFDTTADRMIGEALGDVGTDNEKDTKEKAEILLSTQNMVDQLTKMATDVGKMSTEHVMKLVDEIKIHYDPAMAQNFSDSIGNSLRELILSIDTVRNAVSDQVTAIIDPDSAAQLGPLDGGMSEPGLDGGMDAGMDGAEAGMEGDPMDPDDAVSGDEMSGPEDSTLGRQEKEPA